MKGKNQETLNHRIRTDIESRILSGEWQPGHRIPYEHELMEQYDCSRMTVNKVLTALAENGLIERRRRAGSFVARQHPHLEQVALEIPDVITAISQRGHQYGMELLDRSLRRVDANNPNEVAMGGEGELLAIRCVHLAGGKPFALEDRLINTTLVPEALEQDFSTIAPGSWLMQNVPWTGGQYRLTAEAATAAEASLLKVSKGAACLVINRHTWRGEQPLTWVRQMFLGSSYDLVARFVPGAR